MHVFLTVIHFILTVFSGLLVLNSIVANNPNWIAIIALVVNAGLCARSWLKVLSDD